MPKLAVELAAQPGSHWRSLDGSMLSADISGFTALSEKLAGKGKAGAEEITILINTCFGALIDAAYGYGGEVINFGGDALLVLFRGDEHERRAGNAALAMQAALNGSAPARRANLSMTVGVGAGPFDAFLVGEQRRELLLIGAAASEVIRLEAAADKGQTLAAPSIAATLPSSMIGAEREGGVVLGGEPQLAPGGAITRSLPELALEPFVPAAVVEQLDAFADLGGEHRLVTVGFLMVSGIGRVTTELGPDGAAEQLGRLVDGVGAAVERYGATALHTDIAPDGFKFVLCAGAPVTTGNTSDALLRAALDIVEIESPLTLRLGVQTGRAFAGFLGSGYRRTYTLMGDVVNTAARMLGKANDREIVAVSDVITDTRDGFLTDKLEPFTVKGKSAPITAHQVVGLERGERISYRDGRLHGRDDERDRLAKAVAVGGLVMVLEGGPGSGKSRLVTEALEANLVIGPELAAFRVSSPQFGADVPYGTAGSLLRSGLGIDSMADPAYTGEILMKVLTEHAPDLRPMAPLLALPFGAEVPSTPEADAIGDDFRRARMHDAVVEMIDRLVGGPVVIVAEDVQWIDDGSRELLEHLAQVAADRPWTLLVTRRPAATGPTLDGDHVEHLSLRPLADDAVRRLALEVSEVPLSNEALALVVEKAAGNPLFATELTRAVAAGSQAVPDSVEKLLAARIDDLPPAARMAVRLASVVGATFPTDVLAAVMGDDTAAAITDPALAGIVEPASSGTDGTTERWAFTQTLYRDAAYEGLPYARRRTLHGELGRHLESAAGADVEEIAPVLSRHFSIARHHGKAWAYSVMAGDRAVQLSAPVEALDAYQRALDAGRWTRSVTRRQRSRIASRLGDAAERAGRYDVAAESYKTARSLLAPDDPDRLPLFRKQGVLYERQGRYDQAVRWYRRGLDAAAELDHAYAEEPAELSVAIAGIRFRQGRYDDCWTTASGVADDRTQPIPARFRAHYLLQLTGTYLRHEETETHAVMAQQLVASIDDAVLQSNLYNNLGIAAYYAGEWDRAAEQYQRSYELRSASGDLSGTVSSLNNIGEVRSDQGRLDEAQELLDEAHRRAMAAGYDLAVHVTRLNLGRLAGRRGRTDLARDLLTEAAAAFDAIDAAGFVAEARLRLLEIQEPGPAMVEAARRFLANDTNTAGGATITVPARRLLASALAGSDRIEEAAAEIDDAVEAARTEQLDYELELCLLERAAVARLLGRTDDAEADAAEAAELRERLGVIN
ncbi:MAG: tetratricopeptide repeat protein [Actinomycetota bacterium]